MPANIMEPVPLNKVKKARLVREVTGSASRATGLWPGTILVFIKEDGLENIGVAGTLLAGRRWARARAGDRQRGGGEGTRAAGGAVAPRVAGAP